MSSFGTERRGVLKLGLLMGTAALLVSCDIFEQPKWIETGPQSETRLRYYNFVNHYGNFSVQTNASKQEEVFEAFKTPFENPDILTVRILLDTNFGEIPEELSHLRILRTTKDKSEIQIAGGHLIQLVKAFTNHEPQNRIDEGFLSVALSHIIHEGHTQVALFKGKMSEPEATQRTNDYVDYLKSKRNDPPVFTKVYIDPPPGFKPTPVPTMSSHQRLSLNQQIKNIYKIPDNERLKKLANCYMPGVA